MNAEGLKSRSLWTNALARLTRHRAAMASAVLLLSCSDDHRAVLGVIIGRHTENGPPSVSYAGLQSTLAFLVVLVPDNYANGALEPGYDTIGILFGNDAAGARGARRARDCRACPQDPVLETRDLTGS